MIVQYPPSKTLKEWRNCSTHSDIRIGISFSKRALVESQTLSIVLERFLLTNVEEQVENQRSSVNCWDMADDFV